jgi:hypothetical protein
MSLWSYNQYNVFAPAARLSDITDPNYATSVNGQLRLGSVGAHVHPIAPLRLQNGNRYRAYVRFRLTADGAQPNQHTLYVTFFDVSGNLLAGNTIAVSTLASTTVSAGYVEMSRVVSATGAGGAIQWPAGSAYARVMYRSSGTPTEIAQLYLEDVEAQSAAADQATAASGSAATATSKASEAGQSASAAAGSATTASTKAGEAAVSAGNAATSESNALGSANSAASSSALTASTYTKVITATGNEQFNNGFDGWLDGPTMVAVASSGGRSNVVRSAPGAVYNPIRGRKVPVTADDQRFQLRCSLRCTQAKSMYYVGVIFYDANDNQVTASDGTGNYPLGSGFTLDSSINGWIDREIVIGRGVTEASPYGGTRSIPTGAIYFRPCVYINYSNLANSVTEIDYFTVEDITSQQKAATSANAASTSAANAAASESTAGQRASSANTSANTATTKAGEASTSASNAATHVSIGKV